MEYWIVKNGKRQVEPIIKAKIANIHWDFFYQN